jgi:hypothetical protein
MAKAACSSSSVGFPKHACTTVRASAGSYSAARRLLMTRPARRSSSGDSCAAKAGSSAAAACTEEASPAVSVPSDDLPPASMARRSARISRQNSENSMTPERSESMASNHWSMFSACGGKW